MVCTTNSLKRGAPRTAASRLLARTARPRKPPWPGSACASSLHPFRAVDGHEDGRHQRDQRLVGADVRGGLLAADVLLARGEREHEAALAVAVDGLADEASGHLAHELFFRRDHAAVGAAVAERHAEGLRFHG